MPQTLTLTLLLMGVAAYAASVLGAKATSAICKDIRLRLAWRAYLQGHKDALADSADETA